MDAGAITNAHDAIADLTTMTKDDIIAGAAAESLELSIAYKILSELGFTLGLCAAAETLG